MRKPHAGIDTVDFESQHITYRSIWHAARVLRESAEKSNSNGFWLLMGATILAYTAYEGFLNDVIARLFPEDWKDERTLFRTGKHRGTLGKTKYLAGKLGLHIETSKRPYCTVAELHAWRNELVHPETVRIQGSARADAYAKKPRRAEPTIFAKLARPTFVPRCFEDVATLAGKLLKAARTHNWPSVRDLGQSAFLSPTGIGGASLKR